MNFWEKSEEEDNIWIVASDGDVAGVQKFLAKGISVNAQDESGYSPLHAAASYGHQQLIKFLLENGANPNLTDEDGDTPLLVCEDPAIFQQLMQAGSDPNAVNTEGQGILEKAVEDENEAMVEFLVTNGFVKDPNFKYTPGMFDATAEFGDGEDAEENGDQNEDENDEMQG